MATNIRGRTTCHPSAAFKLKCRREKEQLRAALSLQLQKDMKRLLDHGFYSDLSLTCSPKSFKVHSAIIRTRTPKFYEVYCCQDSAENTLDDNTVHITDLSCEVLDNFIGDIYCNVHLGRDAFPASSYDSCLDELNSIQYPHTESSNINFSDCKHFHFSNMDCLENTQFAIEEINLSTSEHISDFNANSQSNEEEISPDPLDNIISTDSLAQTCDNGNICQELNSLDDISDSSIKESFSAEAEPLCNDSKPSSEDCHLDIEIVETVNITKDETNITDDLTNEINEVPEISQENILLEKPAEIATTSQVVENVATDSVCESISEACKEDEIQNEILPLVCSDELVANGKEAEVENRISVSADSSLHGEISSQTLHKRSESKSSGAWWFSIDLQPDSKTEVVNEKEKEKVENSPGPLSKSKENNSTAFFVNIGNGNAKIDQKPIRSLRESLLPSSRSSLKQQTSPPISPEPDDDLETVYSEFSDAVLFDSAEMKHIDNQSPDEDGDGSVYHKLGYCSKLGQDLLRMFIEEINTDIEIKVEEKKLKAHKCILCTRCSYFAAMLNGNWIESNGNIITLQGFSYNAVHFALLFIYGGVTEIPDNLELSELISLADMLGLEGLKDVVAFTLRMKYCHFFHKPCSICTLGVLECLPLAFLYGLQDLVDKSITWINKHLSRVWVTKSFASLPEELLQSCFKNALVSVNIDTVIDMVLECDRLMTTLPQVKWSEPIFGMTSQLVEACVVLLSTKFTDVLSSSKFLSLGKGLGWNVNIIDEILTSAVHRFSPILACLSYIQLNQLIQMSTVDSDWNEKFICMLKQVAHHCERLLIHNAGQVVRCKEWKLLSEDIQHKIKEAAIFVDDISKPVAQPPKFSSLNRKFNQKRSDSCKDSPEAKRAANKVPPLQTKSISDLSCSSNGSPPLSAEANNQTNLKILKEKSTTEKKSNSRPKSWPPQDNAPEVNGVVSKSRPASAVLTETSSKTSDNKTKPKGPTPKINKTDKGTSNARIQKTNKPPPKTTVNKPNGLTRTTKTKPKTMPKK